MDQRFAGKVALVTGAARGQGRAEAVRFAAEGADVIALDICEPVATVNYEASTSADLDATVEEIRGLGRRVAAEVVDTRDLAALTKAVDKGVDELGRLDVVIANAGICSYGLLWELSEEQFRTMIEVNVFGTWHTIKAAVPIMIRQGTGGAIVLTSSVGGVRGMPWLGHYVASKHAVTGMARTLANELGQYDIRVVSLHPNAVTTPMGLDETLHSTVAESPALGAMFMGALTTPMMPPEDVAAAVAFCTSDEGRFMTGTELVVDLGVLGR